MAHLNENMSVQVPRELKGRIQRLAQQCGTTPSHITRQLLKAAVDRAEQTGEIFTITPGMDRATGDDVSKAA